MNDTDRIMAKLDVMHAEQIEQGKQVAVNTNDIQTLKERKSWLANITAAVIGGAAVLGLDKVTKGA